MITARTATLVAVLSISASISGCKLDLIVSSGGDVTSASGTRDCAGGTVCEFNVTDFTFNDSFTAVARPGFIFSKWSAGDGFQCANSTNPTCTINNSVLTPGNPLIDEVMASDRVFYALPLFTFVGIDTDGDGTMNHFDPDDDNDGVLDGADDCPLESPNLDGHGCPNDPNLVTVNGRQWYQPELFVGVTRFAIAAVCPGGACINGGELNGQDMTGWTWADATAVSDLIYGHYEIDFNCAAGLAAMEADGFRFYAVRPPGSGWGLSGYLSNLTNFLAVDSQYTGGSCYHQIGPELFLQITFSPSAWFYRD